MFLYNRKHKGNKAFLYALKMNIFFFIIPQKGGKVDVIFHPAGGSGLRELPALRPALHSGAQAGVPNKLRALRLPAIEGPQAGRRSMQIF